MKKLVFLGILAVLLVVSILTAFAEEKELIDTVEKFINQPDFSWTGDENSPELRQKFLLVTKLAEKAEWKEIDEVSILLEKIKQEVEEKSRELSLNYLITLRQECRSEECSLEAKKKLEEIYEAWKFQQDIRLGRFFYVIRAFQPRIAVLERKAEADKIRESKLLSFVLEIKPKDSDETVLAKKQQGIREFERRKGR